MKSSAHHLLCLLLLPIACAATPSAGSWRRTIVLGDNAADAFLLRSEWSQPGSYYCSSEKVSVLRVRLLDGSTQDTWVLRAVSHSQDMNTNEWSSTDRDSSSVDLADILRAHEMRPVFAESWPDSFEIDTTGVWTFANDRRALLATAEELRRQIPDLSWEPSVIRIDTTNGWAHGEGYCYLTVRSGACAGDVDWFEDILTVPQARLHEALSAQPKAPRRE